MKKTFKSLALIAMVASLFMNCKKEEAKAQENPCTGISDALFNQNVNYGSVTDRDGNVYKTVTIGTQTWMAENLRTTKFRNGDNIPKIVDNSVWANQSKSAYCDYSNTSDQNQTATYGRLYNWYAVADSRNIAPEGWHVPTEADMATLVAYLGGEVTAGSKIKEVGTTHWISQSPGVTNETGFTALPAGNRDGNGGNFRNKRNDFYCWISKTTGNNVWFMYIGCDNNEFKAFNDVYKQNGFSVRCVKD